MALIRRTKCNSDTKANRDVIHSYTKAKTYRQTDSKALTLMKWFLLLCHNLSPSFTPLKLLMIELF